MWKVSTARVTAGWSARRTASQACGHPVDVASPGERLECQDHAAFGSGLAEPVELLGHEVEVVDGVVAHVRAHQEGTRAQLGGDVELALDPSLRRGEPLGQDTSSVADRLEQVDAQAEVRAPGSDLAAAGAGCATRSLSKISTPSKPAAAMASSLSPSRPLSDRVATPLCIRRSAPRSAGTSGRRLPADR